MHNCYTCTCITVICTVLGTTTLNAGPLNNVSVLAAVACRFEMVLTLFNPKTCLQRLLILLTLQEIVTVEVHNATHRRSIHLLFTWCHATNLSNWYRLYRFCLLSCRIHSAVKRLITYSFIRHKTNVLHLWDWKWISMPKHNSWALPRTCT